MGVEYFDYAKLSQPERRQASGLSSSSPCSLPRQTLASFGARWGPPPDILMVRINTQAVMKH